MINKHIDGCHSDLQAVNLWPIFIRNERKNCEPYPLN